MKKNVENHWPGPSFMPPVPPGLNALWVKKPDLHCIMRQSTVSEDGYQTPFVTYLCNSATYISQAQKSRALPTSAQI